MYKLCIYSTCLSSNTVGTCTVTMFSATMQTRFTLLRIQKEEKTTANTRHAFSYY